MVQAKKVLISTSIEVCQKSSVLLCPSAETAVCLQQLASQWMAASWPVSQSVLGGWAEDDFFSKKAYVGDHNLF